MQNWDRDTYDALLWLEGNKHLFQQEIIPTPFMCAKIKDQRYAYAVDGCINTTQMRVRV